jgi:hypothetical protein
MRQNLQNCLDETKVERVVLNALTVDAALPPDIAPAAIRLTSPSGEVDPPHELRLCFNRASTAQNG